MLWSFPALLADVNVIEILTESALGMVRDACSVVVPQQSFQSQGDGFPHRRGTTGFRGRWDF